ncbi:response regulator transcription factor [Sphingobacterium sp.]|uniref:response regulator transcription factor n=1 Tax=Sphingobacterium sp. TaxID=341027 RepID=UPI00289D03F3|nr:response regulator transcription factor [Sphingobacterium sp.]
MCIKLAIIDDDCLLVELMHRFLRQQNLFNVTFSSSQSKEALDLLSQENMRPDILLLDLKMPELNGVDMLKIIKETYPGITIMIISSHYQDNHLSYMIQQGVAAFLPKGISLDILVRVIKSVDQHGFYLLPSQIDVLRNQVGHATIAPDFSTYGITEREIEILKLIAHQKTAKEIAEILFIAPRTVEGHKNNLFSKTGTKNIAGLVIFGIQKGLINLSEINFF